VCSSRKGKTINNKVRINEEIRENEVRVIGDDGSQVGVMSSAEALKLARQSGVDLVEISPNTDPPVVKIIDWGKYQYQKMKEPKKNKAKGKELKQMRLGLKIGANDLDIKLRKIRQFLADGHRVKITIVFKGREMTHKELGFAMLDRITALLADDAVFDQSPQVAGRNLSVNIRRK
jgi:translation initiation factor IF-3